MAMFQGCVHSIDIIKWYKTNECKLEENPNKFKHKIKDTFFANMQRADDDIYFYY